MIANHGLKPSKGEAHAAVGTIEALLTPPGRRRSITPLDQAALAGLRRLGRQANFNAVFARVLRQALGLDYPRDADPTLIDRELRRQEAEEAEETAREMAALAPDRRPTVTVIMPTHDTPDAILRAAIDSVVNQTYPHWTLSVIDDGSQHPHVLTTLAAYEKVESRVTVTALPHAGISAATNTALETATGDFVCFLDHDDLLAPHALAAMVATAAINPKADLIYSDHDQLDGQGLRTHPFRKPDWSPDLLRGCAYLQHLVMVRRDRLDRVGRFRTDLDGAQDWDMWLRFQESGSEVAHCPKILYHWRRIEGSLATGADAKPYAIESGQRVIEGHLARCQIRARAERVEPTHWQIRYPSDEAQTSIVVAVTRLVPLAPLIDSLAEVLDTDTEVVLVSGGAGMADEPLPARIKSVSMPVGSSRSEMLDAGAAFASGEVIVFLHEDCTVSGRAWLDDLSTQALRPEVGVVGGMLLFPDRRIQSAGMASSDEGWIHQFQGWPAVNVWSVFGTPVWPREVSAVSDACLSVRRPVWDEVGGFGPGLDTGHDVGFCLRVRAKGLRVLISPHAAVTHRYPEHEEAAHRKGAAILAMDPQPAEPFFDRRFQHLVDSGISP